MFRYLPLIALLFFGAPLLADPAGTDCPQEKALPPTLDVKIVPPSPSTTPSSPSGEPTTIKDQIGLNLDPSSMIPDKPLVEEKDPTRKKLLDKISEAKKREVDLEIRRDELARLQKDCDERIQNIFKENQKLLKELDAVIEKKKQTSIFRSLAPLDKESDRIWRELDINGARREKLREQEQKFHDETLSTINEEGRAFIERITLEESLGRMDTSQKKASLYDAERAPIPKMGK